MLGYMMERNQLVSLRHSAPIGNESLSEIVKPSETLLAADPSHDPSPSPFNPFQPSPISLSSEPTNCF